MKKIKYTEIKEILEKNSLKVKSSISDEEIFLSLKTITNSSENDLSFFSNIRYLNDLKNIKAKACLIEEFNFHYQNEIIKIRETILKEILKLLEKYALENSVDLILDSTTYLIASNSLDITIQINSELEKLNLDLEYKDFEKN